MNTFLDAAAFGSSISKDLGNCSHLHCVVSYIRKSGIEELIKLNSTQVEHSQIVTCTDFGITEPEALRNLINKGYRVRSYLKTGLHSKVWVLFFLNQPPVLYVGSSNLSLAAASSNIEANIRTQEPEVVENTIRWLSALAASELVSDIDLSWIEAYEKVRPSIEANESVLPLIESGKSQFAAPAGIWHSRIGGKTFLAQGILEGVTQASSSREQLLYRTRIDRNARVVLLQYSASNELYVKCTIDASLNKTGASSVQLGGGRKKVHQWIGDVWGFDWEKSSQKNKSGTWEDWFSSTNWNLNDFNYQILVDLKDLIPTIWVRPIKMANKSQ